MIVVHIALMLLLCTINGAEKKQLPGTEEYRSLIIFTTNKYPVSITIGFVFIIKIVNIVILLFL